MNSIKEQTVSTIELAEILGISDRRIQQLVNEKELEKLGRGRFNLVSSVQRFIAYQVNNLKEKQSIGTKLDEETRLLKLKGDLAQIDLEKKRGELIPANVVGIVWAQVITAARTKLLGLPSSVKTKRPDIDMEVFTIIEKLIREILKDMSEENLSERYAREADKEKADN